MQARKCSSSSSVLCSFTVSQVIPNGSQPVSFCSFSDFWGEFCGHIDEYFIQLSASTVLTIFAVLGMISTSYLFIWSVFQIQKVFCHLCSPVTFSKKEDVFLLFCMQLHPVCMSIFNWKTHVLKKCC